MTASRKPPHSLIPEDLRPEAHLRIGRLLAARAPPGQRDESIFEIVNQLNRGATLITAREEREQLAEFNLIAGRRAKASTAYAPALTYLTAGATLLPETRGSASTSSPLHWSCTGPSANS
jgi:predicted ATPase